MARLTVEVEMYLSRLTGALKELKLQAVLSASDFVPVCWYVVHGIEGKRDVIRVRVLVLCINQVTLYSMAMTGSAPATPVIQYLKELLQLTRRAMTPLSASSLSWWFGSYPAEEEEDYA
jgi:hypothetical protein